MIRYSFVVLLIFSSFLYSQKNEYLINAEFNILEKSINIKQSLKFNNNTGINLNEIFINDWANSYSNANSPLGKRLSEEYSLSFQRSTKNQRGKTIINEIYNDENKVLTYQRLPSNIDIIKINLDKTLNPGESIYLYFNYQIIIPESDFTKYGISKENDINIRDWFLTVSKFLNGKWLTESNLDLNDLSIDPSEFKFIISYPLDYELVSNLPVLSKYKTNINNVFESKKEVRMNTSILMQKNSLFK